MTTSENSKLEIHTGIELGDEEFRKIAELVYQTSGINLTEKKKALVQGRLSSLLRSAGYSSFGEYYQALLADRSGKELLYLIDRISTNFSFFFREQDHFEYLVESALPEIKGKILKNPYDLRVWCAGAATGEEAYSVAMLLREWMGPQVSRDGECILATDISVSALEHAVSGVYEPKQLKDIPDKFRKYFKSLDDGRFSVDKRIRDMVLFKRLNLMREHFPLKSRFHIIFCRNVMIYFDQATRRKLLKNFHNSMYPGGFLFLGHSETIDRNTTLFKYVRPTVFRKWEK
jgi:chemotaxis protein methyltransferase CheR